MNKYFFIIILFAAFSPQAQVLLPTAETAFEAQHSFNPTFIKTKGIRKITYEILDKKDFEIAVDKSLTEIYEFDIEGRLNRHYYTNVVKSIEKQYAVTTGKGRRRHTRYRTVSEFVYDTVSTSYYYSKGNLILKRYHDGQNYYESRYYRYDSTGSLTKEQRFRETNNSPRPSLFILGNQVLLSEDSFQYTRYNSGQVKCVFMNNENRPYKERISNFDSSGRKKEMNETYTAAAWIIQQYKFSYAGHRLSAASFEGNASNPVVLRNLYEYDEGNELYGEKHYKNDVLEKEVSYITEKGTGLLNSFVIRDHLNKTMRIVKLKYDLGMVGKAEGKQF